MTGKAYIKKSVTSSDGTTIGFRQLGSGPAIMILHGGALASQHYMKLASALAASFTCAFPTGAAAASVGPTGRTSASSARTRTWRRSPRRPGSGAPPLFTGTQDALQKVLPVSTRVVLPGLNHGAAQDQGGNPAVIADRLRQFFS